jgi:hypothetical protein
MRRIYKYQLPIGWSKEDITTITMYENQELLEATTINGIITMWFLVDPTSPIISVKFKVCATGESIYPLDWFYVGTVLDGTYVWHVFQERFKKNGG